MTTSQRATCCRLHRCCAWRVDYIVATRDVSSIASLLRVTSLAARHHTLFDSPPFSAFVAAGDTELWRWRRRRCSHASPAGQLSTSASVCGKGRPCVSGRRRVSAPPTTDVVPNRMPGTDGAYFDWGTHGCAGKVKVGRWKYLFKVGFEYKHKCYLWT